MGKGKTRKQLLAENSQLTTELHAAQEIAKRDELTGLYRRWFFSRCVENDLKSFAAGNRARESDPTSSVFVMLDLKGFALFNELDEGQVAGDIALQHAGEAMKRVLRSGDKLGRMGGDEFGLWLLGMNPARLAEKIDEINASLRKEDQRLAVHYGYEFFKPGMDFQDLYGGASVSLRKAKEASRKK